MDPLPATDDEGRLMSWSRVDSMIRDTGPGGHRKPWSKLCNLDDDPRISVWRIGEGLGLGLGIAIEDGPVMDLPVVELRRVLLESLLDDVLGKLEQLDGHDIMQILLKGLSTDLSTGKAPGDGESRGDLT